MNDLVPSTPPDSRILLDWIAETHAALRERQRVIDAQAASSYLYEGVGIHADYVESLPASCRAFAAFDEAVHVLRDATVESLADPRVGALVKLAEAASQAQTHALRIIAQKRAEWPGLFP